MAGFCQTCAPVIQKCFAEEEAGDSLTVINGPCDDFGRCDSCEKLQVTTFYERVMVVCDEGEDVMINSLRDLIRSYAHAQEKVSNDDIDEGVDELATLAFAPMHPRDLDSQKRRARITHVLTACFNEPRSKLGQHLVESPLGRDFLKSVQVHVDQLAEEVSYTDGLDTERKAF